MRKSLLSYFKSAMVHVSLCMGLMTLCPAQNPVAVQKIQIAEGIYQFATAPDGYVPDGNSIVIVNQDDVLVFDTFSRASTSRTVLAEIHKITNKPVRYVVNSHHHPDHWSGNEVYTEAFPNVDIIATEQSRQYMLAIDKSWPPVWNHRLKKAEGAFAKEVRPGSRPTGRHSRQSNVAKTKKTSGYCATGLRN